MLKKKCIIHTAIAYQTDRKCLTAYHRSLLILYMNSIVSPNKGNILCLSGRSIENRSDSKFTNASEAFDIKALVFRKGFSNRHKD